MTPHSTTAVSPAKILFGRKLRSRLDLLWPFNHMSAEVGQKQEAQKLYHTSNSRKVSWSPATPIMTKNDSKYGAKWVLRIVIERTGPLSYKCSLFYGKMVKRHQDQLNVRTKPKIVSESPKSDSSPREFDEQTIHEHSYSIHEQTSCYKCP